MAIAINSKNSANSDASQTSLTASITVSGSNRVLVAAVAVRDNATVSGVTWDGNAMTQAVSAGPQNEQSVYIFYYLNPDAKTANVIASFDSSSRCALHVFALTDAKITDIGGTGSNIFETGTTSSNVAVTVQGGAGMVIDIIRTSAGLPSVGSGQTQEYNIFNDPNYSASSSESHSGSTTQMDWTFSSSNGAHAAIEIEEDIAAVAGTGDFFQLFD